jgi:hypothetical protein
MSISNRGAGATWKGTSAQIYSEDPPDLSEAGFLRFYKAQI